jgi:hypothetical protein
MCPGSARKVHSEAAAAHPLRCGNAGRGLAGDFAGGCGETPRAGASFQAAPHATTQSAAAREQGGRRERGEIESKGSSADHWLREKQALQALGLPHTCALHTRAGASRQGKHDDRVKIGDSGANSSAPIPNPYSDGGCGSSSGTFCPASSRVSCRRANFPIHGISHS